jgi:TatD DNase family protein
MMWIDTHCHLDAPEFGANHALALDLRAQAAIENVALCVLQGVMASNFDTVRLLAQQTGDAYALGIHPLFVPRAQDGDLDLLEQALAAHRDDPRLVAVGEIGLDLFVPALLEPAMLARQQHFYRAQLKLARKFDLPVILHVRRSADLVLKHLRAVAGPGGRWQGIAHAFNGSEQQAHACIDLGLKLGFGGAVTFERALQLRRLATTLPIESIVMETDAPDIQPHWLYRTQAQRDAGEPQGRNEPAELPRIAEVVAGLRGMGIDELAAATTRNALETLPRLENLMAMSERSLRPA